ncbi:MAG: hypothetical protein AAFU64_19980 [Bacteroidota bacterium]
MKKLLTHTILFTILSAGSFQLSELAKTSAAHLLDHLMLGRLSDDQKKEVFSILDAECQVDHRKEKPFMVFSKKKRERRAPKMHKQVFVKRRMPKGNQIRLTEQEYATFSEWLNTLKIN